MISKGSQTLSPDKIRGWILDAYPTGEGEIAVWIISQSGERIRLTDTFHPKIYVSGKQDDIERLASRFYKNQDIAKWSFCPKICTPHRHTKKPRPRNNVEGLPKIISFYPRNPKNRRLPQVRGS